MRMKMSSNHFPVSSGKHPCLPGQGILGLCSPLQGFCLHSSTLSSLPRVGCREGRQHTRLRSELQTLSHRASSMSSCACVGSVISLTARKSSKNWAAFFQGFIRCAPCRRCGFGRSTLHTRNLDESSES